MGGQALRPISLIKINEQCCCYEPEPAHCRPRGTSLLLLNISGLTYRIRFSNRPISFN